MEQETNDQDKNSFFIGMIIGGIVGAFVALALLGDKDEEVRKNFKKKAKDVIKRLPGMLAQMEEKGKSAAEFIKDEVTGAVETAEPVVVKEIRQVRRKIGPAPKHFFVKSGRRVT
jgi:gas vesicle protein